MKAVVLVAVCFCLLVSQAMGQFAGYNGFPGQYGANTAGQYGAMYGRGGYVNPQYQRYPQGYGTGLWGGAGYAGRYGGYGQGQGGYYPGSDS